MKLIASKQRRFAFLLAGISAIGGTASLGIAQTAIDAAHMKVLGQVDPRYVSYNVEAVEVTGGRFWAPFKSLPKGPA